MRKYFGTDGIRRIANTELSPELVYRVAKSGAYVLSKHTDKTPTILIGRDTRLSGTLIESAMVAGFLSYGANVKLLGVMPTPAVAYLTRKLQADASVVISASHNTFEFNGIKYFSNKGMKIPDELEEEIEETMDSGKLDQLTAVKDKIGVSEVRTDLLDEYGSNVARMIIMFTGGHPSKMYNYTEENIKIINKMLKEFYDYVVFLNSQLLNVECNNNDFVEEFDKIYQELKDGFYQQVLVDVMKNLKKKYSNAEMEILIKVRNTLKYFMNILLPNIKI